MCGIIGILNLKEINIHEKIILGLSFLENRGYDSSGICVFHNDEIYIKKKVFEKDEKPIVQLRNEAFPKSYIGFGHNRWATHGEKTEINAHPHISNNKNIVLVHNGIIENFSELKDFLLKNGFTFYSQTDTEIIVNLLQYYESINPDLEFDKIIQITTQQIKGTFALIIFHKKITTKLFTIRRGSPLLVGYNESIVMIVSEQSGFSEQIKTFIVLNNDDVCIVERKSDRIEMNVNHTYIEKEFNYLKNATSPFPYTHWTMKEIHEQPQTILNALNRGGRIDNDQIRLGGCEQMREKLQSKEHIILLGCGTSFHACLFTRYIMKQCCSFKTISVYDGAEFDENDIPDNEKTLVVFVSQSGETCDLYNSLVLCKHKNITTLGIVNVVDSLIAREVDCGVYCNAEREVGVASTKAFTSQVVCLTLLSVWFGGVQNVHYNVRQQIINDLLALSKHTEQCIEMSKKQLPTVFSILKDTKSLFLLGKGKDECIAREGSLKIKEISYIHSEGYSSSGLKHGPFALLDELMPVVFIHTNNEFEKKILGGYEEISSRKSPIIFITPFRHLKKPNTIFIPENKTFSSLLSIIPLQLLAYELTIYKGYNPDTPRNLAKVVTVD